MVVTLHSLLGFMNPKIIYNPRHSFTFCPLITAKQVTNVFKLIFSYHDFALENWKWESCERFIPLSAPFTYYDRFDAWEFSYGFICLRT